MLKNIIIIQDFAMINGGNAKVAITSAIALKEKGYNIVFFSGMGPVEPSLIEAGVHVICLNQNDVIHSNKFVGFFRGFWNPTALSKLNEVLNKYDNHDTIVHLHGWNKVLSPSVWQPLHKGKYKVVVTMHDYFAFCPNLGLFNYKKKKICQIKPSCLKCYLCNCDSRNFIYKLWRDVRQVVQWIEFLKYGKINVIAIGQTNYKLVKKYFGKHISNLYKLQNPIEMPKNIDIDIKNNNLYLFIGRLSAEKGIDLFCQCMTDLGLKGCVLGDGSLMDYYKSKYPNVQFAGWVKRHQKQYYLSHAKALIFPSLWYEGSPLTPVELKSIGIPCIVPDKCAASEEVDDGKTGFIFKIGQLESLEEAVIKMENANLRKMQSTILADFDATVYSLDTHIESLIHIYEDILR